MVLLLAYNNELGLNSNVPALHSLLTYYFNIKNRYSMLSQYRDNTRRNTQLEVASDESRFIYAPVAAADCSAHAASGQRAQHYSTDYARFRTLHVCIFLPQFYN
jgi:hypothetical protein